MLEFLLFIGVGLIVLFKSSDFLVESAGRLARILGVSDLTIGLTIVALGTSIPELASSVAASLHGSPGIAIGNVLGSNITNIALVLGLVSFVGLVKVDKRVVKRDSLMLLFSSLLVLLFFLNGLFSRIEGLFVLLVFIAYSAFVFRSRERVGKDYGFAEFVSYFLKLEYLGEITTQGTSVIREFFYGTGRKKIVVFREIAIIAVAGIAIVLSASLLVRGAIGIASLLSIKPAFIGLTIIAVGTSLPELSVSLSAVKKHKGNILIGNIIGSNLSNSLFVLGLAAIANPLILPSTEFIKNAVFMCLFTVLFLIIVLRREKIGKMEGIILLVCYALFLFFAY